MPLRFVDTHAHLQSPEFRDDEALVIERAHQAGVATIVVPGVDAETSEAAANLADRHAGVYFAAGFHPHEAFRLDQAGLDKVRSLLDHAKAVAVGEIGLDFYRMHSPRQAQLDALQAMLDLARASRLPLIVHSRDAKNDLRAALDSWSLDSRRLYEGHPLGVMHYFSGSVDEASHYVDLGFLISVHTSVTHPKASQLRDVVAQVPLEALVIETDSPYGAPQPVRGKRNEPAYVVEAAKSIADIKGLPLDQVARVTTANAARLFRLAPVSNDAAVGAQV